MPRARKPAAPAPAARVLVVDDSPDTLELLERHLAAQGYRVQTAARADEALERLAGAPFDLLITDIRMPGRSGLELIDEVRERHPGVEIIVITGFATIEGAVRAMQAGAWNYLAKPFTDDELFHAVRQVLARRASIQSPEDSGGFHGLLGRSLAMRSLAAALTAAAPGDAPVLLIGEAGSGRESSARVLHALSGRPGTFQRVGLDALAPSAGAWPASAEAAVRAAAGGTVYVTSLDAAREADRQWVLDRIAPAASPAAGATARLVIATAAGPGELARMGAVAGEIARNVRMVIGVPPLRERGDDVTILAQRFIAEAAGEARAAPRTLGSAAKSALLAWSWPGNVEELRALCGRLAVAGGTGAVALGELPAAMATAMTGPRDASRSLHDAEREHIERVLQSTGGNKSRAAQILGIDRKTLRDKLRGRAAGSDDGGE